MRLFFKGLLFSLAAFAFVSLAPELSAQVSIQIQTNTTNYLQFEPVFVKVTMRNYSAHPLAFGESKGLTGKLKFEIETPDGSFAASTGESPQMTGLILAAGESKTLTFVISQYYKIQSVGRYKIKAYVEHAQLASEYESNSGFFNVLSGNMTLERTVGVPDYVQATGDKTIPTRSYRIFDFYDGRNKVYVLRVEDSKTVYAVRRLGFDMGASLKPLCEIDGLSRINILLPVSPKVFAFYIYGVDGKLDKREIYMKTSTTPTLVVDKKDGSVVIAGGRAARKDLDYAEYKDLPFMDQAEIPEKEEE